MKDPATYIHSFQRILTSVYRASTAAILNSVAPPGSFVSSRISQYRMCSPGVAFSITTCVLCEMKRRRGGDDEKEGKYQNGSCRHYSEAKVTYFATWLLKEMVEWREFSITASPRRYIKVSLTHSCKSNIHPTSDPSLYHHQANTAHSPVPSFRFSNKLLSPAPVYSSGF